MSINVKYFRCVDVYSVILKSSPLGICMFSLVFGKFKHIKQKDFLLQKALSNACLSGILLPNFFYYFSHALMSLSTRSAGFVPYAPISTPHWTSPHHAAPICRTISARGNQTGESPNLADHNKQNLLTSVLWEAYKPQPELRPKLTAAPGDL